MHPLLAKALVAGIIVVAAWGMGTMKDVLTARAAAPKPADTPDPERVIPAAPSPEAEKPARKHGRKAKDETPAVETPAVETPAVVPIIEEKEE